MSEARRTGLIWTGGLLAGTLGLWSAMLAGPLGIPVLVAAFAFGVTRPRAAATGGLLTSVGLWVVWGELRLVEACNAVNRSPQGRCTHEDVTVKILFEVAILAIGIALTTYAFALRRGVVPPPGSSL